MYVGLVPVIKVVMELVDMNSLGLFDLNILSVQVGPTLKCMFTY